MNSQLPLPKPLIDQLLQLSPEDAEAALQNNVNLAEPVEEQIRKAKDSVLYAIVLGLKNPELSAFIIEHHDQLEQILSPSQYVVILETLAQYRPDLYEIFNTKKGIEYLRWNLTQFQNIVRKYK